MDKRASLCSPNKGRSVCAWRRPGPGTQLRTPRSSSNSSKGAVNVTWDPAALRMGPGTSVLSGTSPPPGGRVEGGVGNSCGNALLTPEACSNV